MEKISPQTMIDCDLHIDQFQTAVENQTLMQTPDEIAASLNIVFTPSTEDSYLNLCVQSGNLLFTSGHTSNLRGKLGAGVSAEEGYDAARQAMAEVLQSVWRVAGSLNHLRVIRLLGCVNATPEFLECPRVINGASDLVHAIFGAKAAGYHARSALGFSTLPGGTAVEIEAIFEILQP
jgi:enamine deaminase RidA (YjgF/YER057c/UK114 family)